MAKKKSLSVGVIGLGSMGMGVARTLLKAGFKVHAFDVRREALHTIRRAGGIAAGSPAEVGANTGIVIVLVVMPSKPSPCCLDVRAPRREWRAAAS
jgi:3-hydroxyisobutyrate dehydrogenase-like beta-hydroxyacid dehydrogenase